MSSSADLDLGSGSGTDTLTGITSYLQGGGSAGTILSASFIGLVVSPFVAFADIVLPARCTTFFHPATDGAGVLCPTPIQSSVQSVDGRVNSPI
ncbi:hypothetical protein [Haloarcula litorea]|uniref:hypothetical protein n=1 Tax=Haloarcula litorea TaxID=3032579 RepID=UPI0023E7E96C|nr:hypothetical protein [Halomicroarcula sp. GDY20]